MRKACHSKQTSCFFGLHRLDLRACVFSPFSTHKIGRCKVGFYPHCIPWCSSSCDWSSELTRFLGLCRLAQLSSRRISLSGRGWLGLPNLFVGWQSPRTLGHLEKMTVFVDFIFLRNMCLLWLMICIPTYSAKSLHRKSSD